MNAQSLQRINALIYRHMALYRQSKLQFYELLYFPTLQMLIWSFVAKYITSTAGGESERSAAVALGLVTGFLLWEFTLRSQVGVANAFFEEVWSKNLTHVFISPMRPPEFVAGMVGVSLIRTFLGVVPAILLAWLLYGYNLFSLGPVLVALSLNLFVMGWWLAVLIVVLTLRYGVGAQSFIWSIATTITPFAAVFYPVAVIPEALRAVAWVLPASHVFEALRAAAAGDGVPWSEVVLASALNVAWFTIIAVLMNHQLKLSRRTGSLVSIGD